MLRVLLLLVLLGLLLLVVVVGMVVVMLHVRLVRRMTDIPVLGVVTPVRARRGGDVHGNVGHKLRHGSGPLSAVSGVQRTWRRPDGQQATMVER